MMYRLLISNIPPGIFDEEDLMKFFADYFSEAPSLTHGFYNDVQKFVLEFTNFDEATRCLSFDGICSLLGETLQIQWEGSSASSNLNVNQDDSEDTTLNDYRDDWQDTIPMDYQDDWQDGSHDVNGDNLQDATQNVTVNDSQMNEPSLSQSDLLAQSVSNLGFSLDTSPPSFSEIALLAASKGGVRATGKALVDWQTHESKEFVQQLLMRRLTVQKATRLPKSFSTEISNALWLQNINFSTEQCQAKKASMDAWYRKLRRNVTKVITWEFYLPWCLLYGHAPREGTSKPGEGDRWDGQSWKGRPTILLIEEYAKRKERFEKPGGVGDYPDALWSEVASVFAQKKMNFSPSDCKKQWDLLYAEYRMAYDLSRRSGEGAVTFDYFDRFNEVFKDSVTVEPEVAISIGAGGSSMSVNNNLVDQENMVRTTPNRKRPAASKSMKESPVPPKAKAMSRMDIQLKQLENQSKLVSEFGLLRQCIAEKNDALRDLTNAILNKRNGSSVGND